MENLLTLSKKILDSNPHSILTGSLMLYLRGIDLNRVIYDIDIIIPDYTHNFIIPDGVLMENIGTGSNVYSTKFICDGIIVDILSGSEEYDTTNDGFRLTKVEELIKIKYTYASQNNEKSEKHRNDLKRLNSEYGYSIPEIKFNDDNDLPF